MMKKYLFLFLIIFSVLGCDNEKIKFTEVKIQKQIGKNCEDNSCAIIDINYLLCEENTPFAENFNKTVLTNMISFIYDQDKKPNSIDEAIDFYIEDFKNDYNDNFIISNEIIMSDTISYNSHKLLCLQSNRYNYSGGAHGLSTLLYYNFEIPSGKLLSGDDLFTNKEAVVKIAEKYFREQNGVLPEQDYDEAGFWFENGFQLSENIGFSKEFMILHYNPYEIAPYATGAILVKIPISDVKQWLTLYE